MGAHSEEIGRLVFEILDHSEGLKSVRVKYTALIFHSHSIILARFEASLKGFDVSYQCCPVVIERMSMW